MAFPLDDAEVEQNSGKKGVSNRCIRHGSMEVTMVHRAKVLIRKRNSDKTVSNNTSTHDFC